MTATLFVTYSGSPDARFDRAYYGATHLPLVEREWGPFGLVSARAYYPADTDSDPVAVAILTFADDAAIGASLASPATPTVMGDVANFTDIEPAVSKGAAL